MKIQVKRGVKHKGALKIARGGGYHREFSGKGPFELTGKKAEQEKEWNLLRSTGLFELAEQIPKSAAAPREVNNGL